MKVFRMLSSIKEFYDKRNFVEIYDVSSVTIRHDLNKIEKDNIGIERCHGGAILKKDFITEIAIKEKEKINLDIKNKLADAAKKFIRNGDSIIIDGGSTMQILAEKIDDEDNLVVLTNSINIAYELGSKPQVDVIVLGGPVYKDSSSVLCPDAKSFMQSYRFNRLFLGADGLDLQLGITTNLEYEAKVNREMCAVSNEVIVVADSSKLGKKSHCLICELSKVDILITDDEISETIKSDIIKLGVELVIV